jgi:multidrug efflux system outer membrane protein
VTKAAALSAALVAICCAQLSAAAVRAQPEPSLPMAFAGLTLAQAQSSGIDTSPDVAAARARVNGSRAALAAARWALAPAGFVGFTESPQLAPTGSSTISAHQTTVGVLANLGDVFGYSPQVRLATAALHKAVADEAASERTERITAAKAYYGALKAAAVLASRTDALNLARAGLHAAKTRFNAGDAPRIDVVRADVAIARAEAGAETGRADDANARSALRAETGVSESALSAAAGGAPPSVPPLARDPDAAVAAALSLRPDVASARRDVDASVSALTAAKFALIPPVTVATGYATGIDSGQRVTGASVSAQVTVPLPFGPAARIAQAQAALDEAAARLAGVKRTVSLETASAARSLLGADRAAAATQRAEIAARQELDATELGYRQGASSSLEVTAARSTYEQARVDLLSAVYDEALAVAIFDVEVGR